MTEITDKKLDEYLRTRLEELSPGRTLEQQGWSQYVQFKKRAVLKRGFKYGGYLFFVILFFAAILFTKSGSDQEKQPVINTTSLVKMENSFSQMLPGIEYGIIIRSQLISNVSGFTDQVIKHDDARKSKLENAFTDDSYDWHDPGMTIQSRAGDVRAEIYPKHILSDLIDSSTKREVLLRHIDSLGLPRAKEIKVDSVLVILQ